MSRLEGYSIILTSREDCHLELVRQYHADHIHPTFAENEVEHVDMWEERLVEQRARGPIAQLDASFHPDPTEFEFSLALLVKDDDKDVVGAAVHEVYLNGRCALISYIVVADWMRGKGAAGALLSRVFENGEQIVHRFFGPHEHLRGVFIEVLQVRDDHSDDEASDSEDSVKAPKFRSTERQLVFKRLGFKPLNLDFVHPGKMKGHRYNIAVASQLYDLNEKRFPASVALQFLEGLVMGILADEGSTDDSEMHQWRSLLGDREYIEVGDEYWR